MKAPTRQQLVKIADWEDLVHAVVNYSVWIGDSAVVTCSYIL
jgi:hypothetical protein